MGMDFEKLLIDFNLYQDGKMDSHRRSLEEVYQEFKKRMRTEKLLFDTIEKHKVNGLRRDLGELKSRIMPQLEFTEKYETTMETKPECNHIVGASNGKLLYGVPQSTDQWFRFFCCPKCGEKL